MRTLRILLILLFVSAGLSYAQPHGFCAVTLTVRNPDGLPLQVPVELVNREGVTVQKVLSLQGRARICDFGFGPYSIMVARGDCGATILPDVTLAYGRTHHFEVILNPCPDADLVRTACSVYFRIRDATGAALTNAVVRSSLGYSATTDEYGRAELPLAIGKTSTFTIARSGFGEKQIVAECKGPVELDREVTLEGR